MNKVYIVVGLYNTMEFLEDAINDKNIEVFAFEPNEDLIKDIYSRYEIPDNYHIIQKAVSNFSGKSIFNICSNPTCSSLKKWGNGPSFGEMVEIEIDTISLNDFIEENKIKEIEWLLIDAQGSDLDVLNGLGEKIKIVRGGKCESLSPDADFLLYEDQQIYSEFAKFFELNKFSIKWKYNINNGIPGKEVNIEFINTRLGRQVGILLMKDENDILEEYLELITNYYDTILVLDGSQDDDGRDICKKFKEVVYYEKDWLVTDDTPQDSIRGVLYGKIKDYSPNKKWVGILHPDEFPSNDVLNMLTEYVGDMSVNAICVQNVVYFPHISQKETWKFERGDKIQSIMEYCMMPGWQEYRYILYDPNIKYDKKHGDVLPQNNYIFSYPNEDYFHHKHFIVRSWDQIRKRIKTRKESGWQVSGYELIEGIDSIFFDEYPGNGLKNNRLVESTLKRIPFGI